MDYYTTPTDTNYHSIRYLYYEYESDLEIYDVNFEELEEEHTINTTEYAGL
jgi:hypothetical protein